MFSYFTGSTAAAAAAANVSPATSNATNDEEDNVPTTRVERSSGAVRPEDAKYADLVLLPNRKQDDGDYLIKVNPNVGKKNKKSTGKKKSSSSSNDHNHDDDSHSASMGAFDVVTAGAFDMVDVKGGGKVPRYIANNNHNHNNANSCSANNTSTPPSLGARCASGEEWIVVSPKKPSTKAH